MPADVSVRSLVHGPLERWADRACAISRALGLPPTNIDPDSVLKAARRSAGLDDWGDERFIEPMRRALGVFDDPKYSSLGRAFIRNVAVRAVVMRLRTQAWLRAHPEAEDLPVRRPIFVLGFPRTGTTALQNLLEQAPSRRALRFWEVTSPVPFHDDFERDKARRLRRARKDLSVAYRVVPEMGEMHAVGPETCEECWPLLATTFLVVNFDICHGLESYGRWLMTEDLEWAYREYRRSLQILLWRTPAEQLVLKCPEHLWFLDVLLKVFPDACIVWTHRDPFDCIASYSSLISLSRRTLQGRIEPAEIGPYILDRFHVGVSRALAARNALGDESRFFDVDFRSFVRDRVGTVHRIEEHFGLERTDAALLDGWLERKRGDARGNHRYDPAMWGLSEGLVHERFGEYMRRFGLAGGGAAS